MQLFTRDDGPALGNRSAPAPQSPTSPIWQAALKKYYSELAKGGVSAAMIDKDMWNTRSPDELLTQIEELGKGKEPQSPT